MAEGCPISDLVLVSVGAWLLVLRSILVIGLEKRVPECVRELESVLLKVACGASFVLYGPLLGWPGPSGAIALAAALGVLLSCCDEVTGGWLAVALGAAAMLWQLGACRVGAAVVHPLLLIGVPVFILRVFMYRKFDNQLELSLEEQIQRVGERFQRVLIPLLGGLLAVAGAVGLAEDSLRHGAPRVGVERFLLGALSPRDLVSARPCPAASGDLRPAALFLALWLGAALLGAALQRLIFLASTRFDERWATEAKLPLLTIDGNKDGEDPEAFQRPTLGQLNPRHQIIVAAFDDPEGSDLSHLTEAEREIVRVCREDKEERYRYSLGGGLY